MFGVEWSEKLRAVGIPPALAKYQLTANLTGTLLKVSDAEGS